MKSGARSAAGRDAEQSTSDRRRLIDSARGAQLAGGRSRAELECRADRHLTECSVNASMNDRPMIRSSLSGGLRVNGKLALS